MKRRTYSDLLTAHVNLKGVLDVDVVKGCTAGIAAHGEKGCYQSCYAANIARFRGMDFSRAVVRRVKSKAQARMIERTVRSSEFGFFRIGTMGEPSHAWEETVQTVEWLAPYSVPVIITKHWHRATDDHFRRLAGCGAIINTSVSALDGGKHLWHRIAQVRRYAEVGGTSVARVISCDFNTDDPIGNEMDLLQRKLLAMQPMIDNPLRVPSTHKLVRAGIIRIRKVKDLEAVRAISMPPESQTYIGHCSGCADLCGAGLVDTPDSRPASPQLHLPWKGNQ